MAKQSGPETQQPAEGQEWPLSASTASGSAQPGLSGGKDEASMRFSRAWLAAVPALAMALTGGAAVAATASPAPSAAKTAAEIARAVREPDAGAAHTRVVVFDCLGKPQIRPRSFVLTCADDNSYLTGLSWSSWTAGSALGKGTWHINNCVPNCAHGHFLTYPVDVTFWRSRPVTSKPGERYFTRITMSETSPLRAGR
jgi:hypothetical protein